MSEAQKPSVGRIVHVFCQGGIGPHPAIICRVADDDSTIDAQIFSLHPPLRPGGHFGIPRISDKLGSKGIDLWWDWPERV